MDALNHADQMRLANLVIDNSDDAEIQKKIDQVVELTSSTRDQAAVALHDCHYDIEKAVDMILEGDQAIVENQWKSAGKKKNKNPSSQAAKSGSHQPGPHQSHVTGSGKNTGSSNRTANYGNSANSSHQQTTGSHTGSGGNQSHQHNTSNRSSNQANSANVGQAAPNQFNSNNNTKQHQQDASESLKNLVGISSSNLISSSDPTTTSATTPIKTSSLQQQQTQHQQRQQQSLQRGPAQAGGRQQQQHQRSTKIPDSAVEMPNNELQVSSLNVQFGELDLRDGVVGGTAANNKGAFQDVLEPNRLGRQAGLPNSHSTIPSQDSKSNRQLSQQQQQQQQLGKGGPRRPYNNSNNNDDRRFYNNSNRGGRQISGNQRPYNQRPGPMNNSNSRGVRTILNRGLQPNSTLSSGGSNQPSSGFPNSIDTWTNSTAEAASKPANADQAVGVGNTLRVGQWSDVAGNEDWSEEDWDAKVMETKVFTPSSKAVDGPVSQKNQPLLTDSSVPSQMNLASKLSETVRDDVSSQQNTLNTVSQQGQPQQSSQKPISHMNDIFDTTAVKAVLEQQNLAAIKPKTSIGMSQYSKETSDAKAVLDQPNLSSMKPKTTMSMNQYNKEASESLKSLVGISSAKGVPSVPPGALPLMSQPQYIMGNAYQPAIFPYAAYQTPDVHYQVAAQTAGRDQTFQSVYSPNDANKFNRGTDGDAPSISTTQAAPVASQTHNQQAFVANALHAGYQLTYAMPGAFNMMPQNLYSAAPIFPHIPQPTNTGSANTVYQKNQPASYQHHTGYSGYDPLIQDYVKQQQNYSGSNVQQQQPTSKSSVVNSELDVASGAGSYNMYGSVNKGQPQANKQANYNDTKGYQQQMSNNGPQQQFGFSHNAQQPTSIAGYPLLQAHNLDGSSLNAQNSAQQQLQQHSSAQRGGNQVNPSKYYPSWN